MKRGFDAKKYLQIQKEEILKRLQNFDRLYLEVGGHLCYDGHASRVLPGYDPKTKLRLLKSLPDSEIIYCVNSNDLLSKKRLGDFKANFKKQTLRDLKIFKRNKLNVTSVVITRLKKENKEISDFKKILLKKVKNVYFTLEEPNYTKSPKYALKAYKNNPEIKVKSKLIIITGAAGGSGKMATAMSGVYQDLKNKINSGYAKIETFPVWNLPLTHPINLAYEAATADLQDKNMIDPYYLKFKKKKSVNYNRDIENFSILKEIVRLITKKNFPFGYHSPTEMGIGRTKAGITNDEICRRAAKKEIERREKVYSKEFKKGRENERTLNRMKEILKKIKK